MSRTGLLVSFFVQKFHPKLIFCLPSSGDNESPHGGWKQHQAPHAPQGCPPSHTLDAQYRGPPAIYPGTSTSVSRPPEIALPYQDEPTGGRLHGSPTWTYAER